MEIKLTQILFEIRWDISKLNVGAHAITSPHTTAPNSSMLKHLKKKQTYEFHKTVFLVNMYIIYKS